MSDLRSAGVDRTKRISAHLEYQIDEQREIAKRPGITGISQETLPTQESYMLRKRYSRDGASSDLP